MLCILEVQPQRLQQALTIVSQMLLQSTRQLPSLQELRDQQEGADKSLANTDYRIKVPITSLNSPFTLYHLPNID